MVGSENACILKVCVLAVQGHSKMVDFDRNRKPVWNVLIVIDITIDDYLLASFQRYGIAGFC